MCTTAPPPRRRIRAIASREHGIAPRRSSATVASKTSTATSSTGESSFELPAGAMDEDVTGPGVDRRERRFHGRRVANVEPDERRAGHVTSGGSGRPPRRRRRSRPSRPRRPAGTRSPCRCRRAPPVTTARWPPKRPGEPVTALRRSRGPRRHWRTDHALVLGGQVELVELLELASAQDSGIDLVGEVRRVHERRARAIAADVAEVRARRPRTRARAGPRRAGRPARSPDAGPGGRPGSGRRGVGGNAFDDSAKRSPREQDPCASALQVSDPQPGKRSKRVEHHPRGPSATRSDGRELSAAKTLKWSRPRPSWLPPWKRGGRRALASAYTGQNWALPRWRATVRRIIAGLEARARDGSHGARRPPARGPASRSTAPPVNRPEGADVGVGEPFVVGAGERDASSGRGSSDVSPRVG